MEFRKRAFNAVNLKYFDKPTKPDKVFNFDLNCPYKRQYILRMMIKEPHKDFNIPEELLWLEELISKCSKIQKEANIRHSYCYITVRHGIHTATTEDQWHTDGYSEVLTHLPEQNYVVTSDYPTEYVSFPLKFPKGFNPLKDNIVTYIDQQVNLVKPHVHKTEPNTVYVFDPYVIHRRPLEAFNKHRTFVRVTFVPIEICDDLCNQNPNLPKRQYNRTAESTRNLLI